MHKLLTVFRLKKASFEFFSAVILNARLLSFQWDNFKLSCSNFFWSLRIEINVKTDEKRPEKSTNWKMSHVETLQNSLVNVSWVEVKGELLCFNLNHVSWGGVEIIPFSTHRFSRINNWNHVAKTLKIMTYFSNCDMNSFTPAKHNKQNGFVLNFQFQSDRNKPNNSILSRLWRKIEMKSGKFYGEFFSLFQLWRKKKLSLLGKFWPWRGEV